MTDKTAPDQLAAPFEISTLASSTSDAFVGLALRAGKAAVGDLIPARAEEVVAVMRTMLPEERHLPSGQTAFTGRLTESLFMADEKMLKSLISISSGGEQDVYRAALDAVQVARLGGQKFGLPIHDVTDYISRQQDVALIMA